MTDTSKKVFLDTWTTAGYVEQWDVYEIVCGLREEEVVNKILVPFYDKEKVCLEIGCGGGFWTDKYLAPNFKEVIALDLLPDAVFKHENIFYIEVPSKSFNCYGVEDNSIDFVFSFGVFCHLSLDACREYVKAIYAKCKEGAKVSLYFSNNNRRPHISSIFDPLVVGWTKNDFDTTKKIMEDAGFKDVKDLMPELCDTIIGCRK